MSYLGVAYHFDLSKTFRAFLRFEDQMRGEPLIGLWIRLRIRPRVRMLIRMRAFPASA